MRKSKKMLLYCNLFDILEQHEEIEQEAVWEMTKHCERLIDRAFIAGMATGILIAIMAILIHL